MSDEIRKAWKGQPGEEVPVNVQKMLKRRARQLYWGTRREILVSVAAALALLLVVPRWLAPVWAGLTVAAYVAVAGWVVVSLVWYRRRLSRRFEDAAASGVEHYRRELQHRRDHLRNAWIWHGPLLLACLFLTAGLAGKALPEPKRLFNMLPFVLLLVGWVVFGVVQRQRMARAVEQEQEDLEAADGNGC